MFTVKVWLVTGDILPAESVAVKYRMNASSSSGSLSNSRSVVVNVQLPDESVTVVVTSVGSGLSS